MRELPVSANDLLHRQSRFNSGPSLGRRNFGSVPPYNINIYSSVMIPIMHDKALRALPYTPSEFQVLVDVPTIRSIRYTIPT